MLTFVQFKVRAQVTHGPWKLEKGWTLTKHKPHLTVFEIKVEESILNQVIGWMYEHSRDVFDIIDQLELSHWHVFEKKRFNMAVLADIRFIQDNPNHPLIAQRCRLLQALFAYCGWVGEPTHAMTEDGLDLWLYKDAAGTVLFSCSRYNRPEVWYPHVSIAIQFNQRTVPTVWQPAHAQTTSELMHEVLSKE